MLSFSAWTQRSSTSLPILSPLNWGQSLILSLRTRGVKKPTICKDLVGAVGIEHDPQTTKSRGMKALQPPAKSNC